jgi:hypothetical protein
MAHQQVIRVRTEALIPYDPNSTESLVTAMGVADQMEKFMKENMTRVAVKRKAITVRLPSDGVEDEGDDATTDADE